MSIEGIEPWRWQAAATSRGRLVARLADNADEVAAARALRHEVFFSERGLSRDAVEGDRFDEHCDHLLVIDEGEGRIVGTYRLLSQEAAEAAGGFYTQEEFDVAPLIARMPKLKFLELGRSCVLKEYRTKPVIGLLWQAIWDYVRLHRLDAMFGCASFEGTDPDRHAPALSFLARTRLARGDWRVSARARRRVEMERLSGPRSTPGRRSERCRR